MLGALAPSVRRAGNLDGEGNASRCLWFVGEVAHLLDRLNLAGQTDYADSAVRGIGEQLQVGCYAVAGLGTVRQYLQRS